MMKPNSGVANKGIQRMLGLSADAHIRRRRTAKDSLEFHNLTATIAAYGKALDLLSKLPRYRQAGSTSIEQPDLTQA